MSTRTRSLSARLNGILPRLPSTPSRHWSSIASRWDLIGPPLRPGPQDIAIYSSAVHAWAKAHGSPRALILGVTPELYHLRWPKGTDLLAIDHSQRMIDAVWPGPRNAVLRADWRDMRLTQGSRDVVLCDGGLVLLSYPQDHVKLVQALHLLLTPGGLCVFRLFVPPATPEKTETVLGDLLAGRVANPNILKLRLGMALQDSCERGVQLGHIWEVLHQAAPDLAELAQRHGWPAEPWLAINAYRNSPTRYHFLSAAEVHRLFCDKPGGFALESTHIPDYTFGERCPLITLRRND